MMGVDGDTPDCIRRNGLSRPPSRHATSEAKIVDSIRFDAFSVCQSDATSTASEKIKRIGGGGTTVKKVTGMEEEEERRSVSPLSVPSANASARTSECGVKNPPSPKQTQMQMGNRVRRWRILKSEKTPVVCVFRSV